MLNMVEAEDFKLFIDVRLFIQKKLWLFFLKESESLQLSFENVFWPFRMGSLALALSIWHCRFSHGSFNPSQNIQLPIHWTSLCSVAAAATEQWNNKKWKFKYEKN